ncbi:MAG: DNA methyltransferase [Candidatus Paceibacterota bacterium]
MQYIFFLGRTPSMSLSEIQAMLEKYKVDYSVVLLDPKFLILDMKEPLDVRNLFVQMGGTLKIAEVLKDCTEDKVREEIVSYIRKSLEEKSGKKSVGYSVYFTKQTEKNKEEDAQAFFLDAFSKIKREELKDFSIRIVYPLPRESTLSTATIFNNKLTYTNKGIEFDIIYDGKKIILGRTLIVQDIESYGARDYDKPGKDAKIGMMPPKLAQVMVNLAQVKEGQTIFDPFCGTGTILQEALLDDYRIVGSDANDRQIEKCKENLEWLSKQYILTYGEYKIFQASYNEAIKRFKPDSIDAIVTESTLGPVYKKMPNNVEIKENYSTLKKLYTSFLQNVKPILKNGGRIVITLPAYQLKLKEYVFGEFIDSWEKLGYSRVCPLDKQFESADTRITKRNTIIYSRPEQKVAREIIVLKNNK